MVYRIMGGIDVIHVDVTDPIGIERTSCNDYRKIRINQPVDQFIPHLRRLQQDAVQQSFARDARENTSFVLFGVHQEESQGIVVLVACLSNALGEAWKIRVSKKVAYGTREHQPNHPGAVGCQAASSSMRVITGRNNDFLHSITDFITNIGIIIHHP